MVGKRRAKTFTSITSVLVDYDDRNSLFAELEEAHRQQKELANSSTGEKTTRAIQNLLDNSMTRLTLSESRIELFTNELRTQEGRQKMKESMSKIVSDIKVKESGQKVKQSMTKLIAKRNPNSINTNNDDDNNTNNNTADLGDENEKMKQNENESINETSSTSVAVYDDLSLKSISIEEEESDIDDNKQNPKSFRITWGFRNQNDFSSVIDDQASVTSETKASNDANDTTPKVTNKFEGIGQQTKSLLSRNNLFAGLKVASARSPIVESPVAESIYTKADESSTDTEIGQQSETKASNDANDSTPKVTNKFEGIGQQTKFLLSRNNPFAGLKVAESDDKPSSDTQLDKKNTISPVTATVGFGGVLRRNPFAEKVSADEDIEKEIAATLKEFSKDKLKSSSKNNQREGKKIVLPRFPGFGSNNAKEDKAQDSKVLLGTILKNKFGALTAARPKKSIDAFEEEDVLFLDEDDINPDESTTTTAFDGVSQILTKSEDTEKDEISNESQNRTASQIVI